MITITETRSSFFALDLTAPATYAEVQTPAKSFTECKAIIAARVEKLRAKGYAIECVTRVDRRATLTHNGTTYTVAIEARYDEKKNNLLNPTKRQVAKVNTVIREEIVPAPTEAPTIGQADGYLFESAYTDDAIDAQVAEAEASIFEMDAETNPYAHTSDKGLLRLLKYSGALTAEEIVQIKDEMNRRNGVTKKINLVA